MRRFLFFLLLLASAAALTAQTKPVKVAKNANYFYYQTYEYDDQIDTQYTVVEVNPGIPNQLVIDGKWAGGEYYSQRNLRKKEKGHIPGYSYEDIFIDENLDSVYTLTTILTNGKAETYMTAESFIRSGIKFDTTQVGGLTRYTCSINSNKLEFYVQPHPRSITPVPYYGKFNGLLVSFWRNGQCRMLLTKTERKHSSKFDMDHDATRVTSRELNTIKRDRMVITTRIFDDVQLSWGQENSHVEGSISQIPYDSVLHFAGGTLALVRLELPYLPDHYQTFVEIHQRSNGDAYDRTGSLFVIPFYYPTSFLDGIIHHPDSLPIFTGRDEQHYQGIRLENDSRNGNIDYMPPLELVRFFTSFGVGKFNDRVKLDGLEWEEENYYKQEVTDVSQWLIGQAWIGIWIGNYDGGGHHVTVDLKSYPTNTTWDYEPFYNTGRSDVWPLFNTCNVLEMAGQNYGRLFGTDSLTVDFIIPDGAGRVSKRLRYITTGHGGWGGGDEFNPKPNTILVDGKPRYVYTPWRCDCGRYREWNPVSGNFWNGMSSSDYSRSGWCPGTATQPVYFDLSDLTPGQHTITIAIPQGESQEGSFSHWNVSGALLLDK